MMPVLSFPTYIFSAFDSTLNVGGDRTRQRSLKPAAAIVMTTSQLPPLQSKPATLSIGNNSASFCVTPIQGRDRASALLSSPYFSGEKKNLRGETSEKMKHLLLTLPSVH
jgi:hypothetical protein